MNPVSLNPEETRIRSQQNGYFVLGRGNREDILLFHDITGID